MYLSLPGLWIGISVLGSVIILGSFGLLAVAFMFARQGTRRTLDLRARCGGAWRRFSQTPKIKQKILNPTKESVILSLK